MSGKSILIYSGGMDSTVLLHLERRFIVGAIHFQYGSKHNSRELECARLNCAELGIKLFEIDIARIFKYSNSALLADNGEIPDGHYEDEMMKQTVVPFRNGVMLSIAASIAESLGADSILIANHAGDHAIYPDCRATFIEAMRDAVFFGTGNKVDLFAPFTQKTKRDIAEIGKTLDVDFNKTYSCYKGGKIHCGTCGTCVERKEALEGFDLTQYEK